MSVRVAIQPALYEWALERAGKPAQALEGRFPRLNLWIEGAAKPTFKQAEDFAKATYTPLGLLLLPDPPVEPVPIPDFRTFTDEGPGRPSANLLDTLYICQQRQDWYRTYALANEAGALPFVGSVNLKTPIRDAAQYIREATAFGLANRRTLPNWSEALRVLIENAEAIGVLVMVSGIVGSNTHRVLDPEEFRGFALVDDLAPVVFVNGTDTKAAQIFTVVHELAHLWIGQSAVSDAKPDQGSSGAIEQWCNQVAAEMLVPEADLRAELEGSPSADQVQSLAARFRVSTLVVLRRMHDCGFLDTAQFIEAFGLERERVMAFDRNRKPGGNFFNTLPVRASKRFTHAIVGSTLEGQTLYRDAFRLLGFRKQETFEKLREHEGFI